MLTFGDGVCSAYKWGLFCENGQIELPKLRPFLPLA